jgi:hypothetical protein
MTMPDLQSHDQRFSDAMKYMFKRKEGGALVSSLEQTMKGIYFNISDRELNILVKRIGKTRFFDLKKGFIIRSDLEW